MPITTQHRHNDNTLHNDSNNNNQNARTTT